jgi:ribosomal protein S18 acetylase RimI-like enzyme
MSNPIVTTAKRADESRIASLMTLSFANDPAGRRQYPDPLQYLTHFPEFVRLYGGKAFDHNCAHIIEGGAGAALWLPPGEYPDDDALNALYHRSIADDCKSELLEVFEQMSKSHPDEPHWFMALIGVDPIQHGRGLGSALLYHGVTICDREKTLAYLERTNSRNLPLYERHGFEVRGTIRVGEHPPVYPMVRRPR